MKQCRAAFGLLTLSLTIAMPTMASDYDLVTLDGRVMDPETEYDAVANVGVKDGQITALTQSKIGGKQTIDATGHVVARLSSIAMPTVRISATTVGRRCRA